MKNYLNFDVLTAAQMRIKKVFDNFEKVYVSFSGGKDSGILLNLAIEEVKKRPNWGKMPVLFIDLEGQYQNTIDYIKKTFEENSDFLDPYWVCLPLNLRNAISVYQPFWTCWDPEQEEKWIRQKPDFPVIDINNCPFPFFKPKMEFEEFTPKFGNWLAGEHKTACLVGIRTDESLNRFRAIKQVNKKIYSDWRWTTKISDYLYNAYPIYDWRTEDIWTANAQLGWSYNPLYDLMYYAGVGIHQQRICQPYGDDQRIGLSLFRVLEPKTWAKVVNRVVGANFGNIYSGQKVMGYGNVTLPDGHTWRSYTKLLLASLPPELELHYRNRFAKFIRHWRKHGSPVSKEYIEQLPKEAIRTFKTGNRGSKDKELIRYRQIPDTATPKLESGKMVATWRRMAICILKNDHLCKTLSFTQTKEQQAKISEMLQRYKDL